MALDADKVREVARLARLHLEEDEIARMTGELDGILGYIRQLQGVDTAGIEPVANVAGLENVTRPDEPGAMLGREAVLGNAPCADQNAFLVPKAVER